MTTVADVRGAGFSSRAPLSLALDWVRANTAPLPAEAVPVHLALGRVLTSAPDTTPWPPADRAAWDGFAVRAADTEGAGDYAPMPLRNAAPVAAGMEMPPGADAVLPFSASHGGMATQAAAPGAGVERRGAEGGAPPPGPLRPEGVALLALLGAATVEVVRRPRVALVVAGPKSGPDVLTPMLGALAARDGGTTGAAAPDADLVLMAGRTGCGRDDDAPQRLAALGGALDLHGITLRPGDSAGLGRIGAVPVVLLPGAPLAALSAYEVLAGPALRRLGGRAALPPWTERPAVLARKITSAIGCTDLVRVRLADGQATPLGPADAGGLGRAALSDGWVVVPEDCEGYPAGAAVAVRCPLPWQPIP